MCGDLKETDSKREEFRKRWVKLLFHMVSSFFNSTVWISYVLPLFLVKDWKQDIQRNYPACVICYLLTGWLGFCLPMSSCLFTFSLEFLFGWLIGVLLYFSVLLLCVFKILWKPLAEKLCMFAARVTGNFLPSASHLQGSVCTSQKQHHVMPPPFLCFSKLGWKPHHLGQYYQKFKWEEMIVYRHTRIRPGFLISLQLHLYTFNTQQESIRPFLLTLYKGQDAMDTSASTRN